VAFNLTKKHFSRVSLADLFPVFEKNEAKKNEATSLSKKTETKEMPKSFVFVKQ